MLRVVLTSVIIGAGAAASACDYDLPTRARALESDSPIVLGPDCSFEDNAAIRVRSGVWDFEILKGWAALERGNGRIGQKILRSHVCGGGEFLLFLDCNTGEALLMEGGFDPSLDYEPNAWSDDILIKYIQPPYGPVSIDSASTVADLVQTAQANEIYVTTDVEGFFSVFRKQDRYDFMCGCKLFYPDTLGAKAD